jgi:hypothetical protein
MDYLRTRCRRCGSTTIAQSIRALEMYKELLLTERSLNVMNEIAGVASDVNKLINGEWEPCQCPEISWAINQDFLWINTYSSREQD